MNTPVVIAVKTKSPRPTLFPPDEGEVPEFKPIIVLLFTSVTLRTTLLPDAEKLTDEPEFKALSNAVNVIGFPVAVPVSASIVREPPDGIAATPNWSVAESIVTINGVPPRVFPLIPEIKAVANCWVLDPVAWPILKVFDSEEDPTLFK